MTPKTQASQIVQKHYKIIESYARMLSIEEMMAMAKEHATKEVKGMVEAIKECVFVDHTKCRYWNSILDEIETI